MTILIIFIFILWDSENAMSRQQPIYIHECVCIYTVYIRDGISVFSDLWGTTHVIHVDPSFCWLLHDDWNRANGLELLPK